MYFAIFKNRSINFYKRILDLVKVRTHFMEPTTKEYSKNPKDMEWTTSMLTCVSVKFEAWKRFQTPDFSRILHVSKNPLQPDLKTIEKTVFFPKKRKLFFWKILPGFQNLEGGFMLEGRGLKKCLKPKVVLRLYSGCLWRLQIA